MRYIVGIDLGTTNCALAYIDTEQPLLSIHQFSIPQLTVPGKCDPLPTLPSFCYLAASGEWPQGALKLPWKEEKGTFVGQLAKSHGAKVPPRLVQSAKSWLCNVAANRRDKILPIEAADLSQRLSPVEASSKYLIHLRDAWNAAMAKGDPALELEEQEVIITVPASFDEVARNLTVEATRLAGLNHFTLVEEPQAAFYSWISQHEQEWKKFFKEGDTILVCDVGGGTTDFSLIEIEEKGGLLSFQRKAVGDHLLLGGDNMDVALAHYIEDQLKQKGHPPLESNQWMQLQAEARAAKEALLTSKNQERYSVSIQGTGSSVVKGSVSIEITRQEVESLLLNGFFGRYPLKEALELKQSRGFRTMGLPYEDEPSITKHLAYFLKQTRLVETGKGVNYLLFNGGALKPTLFQESVEQSLKEWFPKTSLQTLSSISLDLAVARGAAYYGKVRRGLGVAIGGGLPRNYYIKIDVIDATGKSTAKALTLLPRGSEENHEFHPPQIFSLRPNMPVSFHVLTSHVRLEDREGDIIDIDPVELQPLPQIQTILRFGKKQQSEDMLPVKLGIRLSPIGTIDLWLDSQKSEHRWELEFQTRSVTGQEPLIQNSSHFGKDETFDKGHLEEAKKTIEHLFQQKSTLKPTQIMEHLEAQIGKSRREWGLSLLRELWTPLLAAAVHRKITLEHEARWWNLAGYFLRPGFGYPLDDFRLKEMWKIVLSDFKSVKSGDTLIQMWICFRRIAGGLSKGQQQQIAAELASTILDKKTGEIEIRKKGELYPYSEKIRALASFERIELPLKIRLGNALVARILKESPLPFDYWALSRFGARHLLYGSAGQVVPKEVCEKWVEKLLHHQPTPANREEMIFLLIQLARKTDHRELNLSDAIVTKILEAYPLDHLKEWLLEVKSMSEHDQEHAFGEQLPSGIALQV